MKSAPAPEGELRRRVFWHRDRLDLQVYKSAAPLGLNHHLDVVSAAWRRRVANCAKKKKKRESSATSELILERFSCSTVFFLCLFFIFSFSS